MKARDRAAISALRATLAALDNAEAIAPTQVEGRSLAIEALPSGARATEAARRVLTEDDVAAIVRAEAAERGKAATEYADLGQPDRAEQLRAEARVLLMHLDSA